MVDPYKEKDTIMSVLILCYYFQPPSQMLRFKTIRVYLMPKVKAVKSTITSFKCK